MAAVVELPVSAALTLDRKGVSVGIVVAINLVSIEWIEMECMLAKDQVKKEIMIRITELDKKRRVDMLVLLGLCRQADFNAGKPKSSLDVAANLLNRPSTTRKGDTLTVSNNDERLLSSSRDVKLATARDLTEEVVAKLHNEIEKCSTGEVLVHEKNTKTYIIKSANPLVDDVEAVLGCQQVDHLVSCNVTDSTFSSIQSTCVVASGNSPKVPANTCIGKQNVNVGTSDIHRNNKADDMHQKREARTGGDNHCIESSSKGTLEPMKTHGTDGKEADIVGTPKAKNVSHDSSSDVDAKNEVNSDEVPLSKIHKLNPKSKYTSFTLHENMNYNLSLNIHIHIYEVH
ncbi:hypothetical protein TRIUR3_24945 [Triticum urartu]|uniref:Uncharacterized protein n=1 Tax=Triticum urartu TaxID=4572 RepID=M8A180_TRIUA|nr:hypothetical protein TRIUR3_24945 [Triticum urartu]